MPTWLVTLMPAILVLVALVVLRIGNAFVYIDNEKYGIVERKWSLGGSKKNFSFMALGGGPGFLPKVIRGGWHFFLPFQYSIHKQPLIVVSGIGYLFARVGAPLGEGQVLGQWPEGVSVEDIEGFLNGGGQSGPQRRILRAGTYAINTAAFAVLTQDGVHVIGDAKEDAKIKELSSQISLKDGYAPTVIGSDDIGVVTVQDGPSLAHGEVIAPAVGVDPEKPETFHNSFQDPVKFLLAGGRRGRQEQVLVEGTYFVNSLFATVERKQKIHIPVGSVGVVISFTGKTGAVNAAGEDFKHGQLVENGQRGIWKDTLPPGKYAINPFAAEVRIVPTTNFQLRWARGAVSSHKLDDGLSEVRLVTSDAFEPDLPLQIVVHVLPTDAPKFIQKFGSLEGVVQQSLDPLVAAFFRDSAQKRTLLELFQQRAEMQAEALTAMTERFAKYELQVAEVVIGAPKAPQGDTRIETILAQLRDRQVAAEQAVTLTAQAETQAKQRDLNEASAKATQQERLTASSIAIQVAENEGAARLKAAEQGAKAAAAQAEGQALAAVAQARGEAEATVARAEAAAKQTKLTGDAEAAKISAIGKAQGEAAKAQVDGMGGAEFAIRKVLAQIGADAIGNLKQPLVPQIIAGGSAEGGEAGHSQFINVLLALMVGNHLKAANTDEGPDKKAA